MTIEQDTVIWEMRRKGLHELANRARQRWQRGELFELDHLARTTRQLRAMIERCNRQARHKSTHA